MEKSNTERTVARFFRVGGWIEQEIFPLALRDIAEARGFSKVALETHLNRENLYRMLSSTGNPQLSSLISLLWSMGLRLAVEVETG